MKKNDTELTQAPMTPESPAVMSQVSLPAEPASEIESKPVLPKDVQLPRESQALSTQVEPSTVLRVQKDPYSIESFKNRLDVIIPNKIKEKMREKKNEISAGNKTTTQVSQKEDFIFETKEQRCKEAHAANLVMKGLVLNRTALVGCPCVNPAFTRKSIFSTLPTTG